jgi:hypothetical protein
VRYRAKAAPIGAGHCHCRDCQRASGAGHITAALFNKGDLEITGDLKAYSTRGGSGREARRFFCPNCGSMIYAESDAGPGVVSLSAGTLDEPSAITPQFAVFDRDRPSWDEVPGDISRHHTVPV